MRDTLQHASRLDETIERAFPLARSLALQAGALLRDRLHDQREIEFKGEIDIVTDVDHAAEALIRDSLHEAFPDHRITGEEGAIGSSDPEQPFGWVIDPLDGTTNYAHRYPHFAVSIALEHHGVPVAGAVYDPMRDEMFAARAGHGATLNDRPIRVSTTDRMNRSLMATGFSYDVGSRSQATQLWEAFNNGIQGLRRDGAAALNICWVAAGRLDGYFERPVQSWDMAAGVLIAQEAGGKVTAIEHDGFDIYTPEALVSNGLLHDHIRALILETLQHP